jgi:hypothetical protein
MSRSTIRWWFCVAVAVMAAAVADPFVEACSNAGLFGSGAFTDHSNAAVVPALFGGSACLAVYLILRVRRELLRRSCEALRPHFAALLPRIAVLQMLVLFAMESSEQFLVYGHFYGGAVWLGGPVWFSLTIHALVGAALAIGLARLLGMWTRTTVRAIRLMRALAMRALHAPAPLALRPRSFAALRLPAPVLCRIGNRAPPYSLG